jgi:hydroxyacylglutathione hydrolase
MNELNFSDKFLRSYQQGEVIYKQGSIGQEMYVVNSGLVIITSEINGKTVFLATIGKGEIFGEMALVDKLPRSSNAVAGEANTELLVVDHAHFVYLVGQQPAFALMIQKTLSLRLRSWIDPEIDTGGAASDAGISTATAKDGIVQLQENVYQLRGQCMSYLILGTKKNLLIDTGLPWDMEQLETQLNTLGLSRDDIHMVVLTHEHLDHIGGIPTFSHRAVVAAHTLAANKICMQDEFVLMSKTFRMDAAQYHVDIHLNNGTKIDLGGTTLVVLHTPGHSSGSLCLYEPDRRLMFTGDTVFANGVLGGIFPSGSISDYTLTLRQLSSMRIAALYPGHGRVSETPEKDLERAVYGSVNLLNDTRSLFNALDASDEFARYSAAVSTYAKRV